MQKNNNTVLTYLVLPVVALLFIFVAGNNLLHAQPVSSNLEANPIEEPVLLETEMPDQPSSTIPTRTPTPTATPEVTESHAIYLPNIFSVFVNSPVTTNMISVPTDQPLACDWAWTARLLSPTLGRTEVYARRMYFSSCNTESDSPTMFASMTVGHGPYANDTDGLDGAIVETRFNPATNKLEKIREQHFPECIEMMGIASSDSCGTVAALCRTDWGRTDFDKDVAETYPGDHWLTEQEYKGNERDQVWLYEWKNGDIQSEPDKYIVHKAIGQYELGQQYLVYGENDNSYGISVKSTHQGHIADSYLILNRDDYTLSGDRGWDWNCAWGHVLHNRPSYNPDSGEYGILCGTDYTINKDPYGSIAFTAEAGRFNEFHHTNVNNVTSKGAPGSLVPLADGGWLAIFNGVDDGEYGEHVMFDPTYKIPWSPATKIGLARLNQAGELVSKKWVVDLGNHYASYQQLVPLENGNYLLGYGKMAAQSDDPEIDWYWAYNNYLRHPLGFYVQEIDIDGNAVTEPELLRNSGGWGEVDQLVSLGNNKVGWAYLADGTIDIGDFKSAPACSVDDLQFNVYHSPIVD